MTHSLATYCIYPSMSAVHTGAEALKAQGFRHTDISVLYTDRCGSKEFVHGPLSRAPEGAAAGAAAGASVGGLLGYLAGIGALTVPGLGPLLAAGPLVAAFAGAGAAGAAGGFIGALVGLGIPECEAKRYEGRLREGGILVSVHCDDGVWAKRAENILTQTGAEDVAAAAEKEANYQS
jgi:hypothetical protein